MKTKMNVFLIAVSLLLGGQSVFGQNHITIVTPATEVAEGLDLYAVADLFGNSKNIEEFEAALNDPEIGVNNLDLDRDGNVDYIRVVEMVVNYRHVIILQVPFRANEFQDIATIEIERTGYDDYRMHIRGCVTYYGPHYYFSFGYARAYHWPIISWIFGPAYRPYRSVFYFGYYPHWWRPYRHVTLYDYHYRNARHGRGEFYYRNRADRFAHRHEGDHSHRSDSRPDRPENRDYAAPRPDRPENYGRPPEQREERRSINPQLGTPERRDRDRELNNRARRDNNGNLNQPSRPEGSKEEHFRREARQSAPPATIKTPGSGKEASTGTRQRVERRSAVDQDNKKIAAVSERRRSSR